MMTLHSNLAIVVLNCLLFTVIVKVIFAIFTLRLLFRSNFRKLVFFTFLRVIVFAIKQKFVDLMTLLLNLSRQFVYLLY